MSNLLGLPKEILIIIIKKLDIKSVYNLYKTCRALKDVILMEGVIKICNLSCNGFATSKSLKLDMIKLISGHLHALNMCGVCDLRQNLLLPAIAKMKRLKTLDVSYTYIDLIDMVDLYKKCPTIKNVSVNIPEVLDLTTETLQECQEVYKNFNNVHFVIKMRLTHFPFHVLKNSSLDTLKYTVCDLIGGFVWDQQFLVLYKHIPLPFNHLSIFMVNYGPFYANQIIPQDELENFEYIIIEYNAAYSISTTPMFTRFFLENFQITSIRLDIDRAMYGTFAIFIWNKKTTIFDELFLLNLKTRIKEILVCKLEVAGDQSISSSKDIQCYDWFHIHPIAHKVDYKTERADPELHFKKRRIAQNDQILDYDKIFIGHEKIKLAVNISQSLNVTLSSNSEYLSKLTYLSLAGSSVRYSNDFFNVLFRCCKNLHTLNVEASSLSRCCSFVMRSIPLSQSLKNIRIVDKRIDLKTLFSSFTQCKTLETICVIDNLSEMNELSDLLMLYQCVNLFSVHIAAEMKRTSMKRKLFREIFEHFNNFTLQYPPSDFSLNLDPYMHIFNLKPIKAV